MDMRAIISQLAVLFILLALGYVGYKLKALSADTSKALTKLVFNITLPLSILSSVIGGDIVTHGGQTAIFMLMTLGVYAVYVVISLPAARLLTKEKGLRGLYAFMMIFSNVAFMGFPVTSAIFGPQALFYNTLFNIPFWISSFSFGLMMIAGEKGRFRPKSLLTPLFISSMLVIPLALTGFRAPMIIQDAVRIAGNITTPASMIIIGITLAQEPIRGVFKNLKLYPLSLFKLIIIPVAVWLVFRPFIESDLTLGVIVILSGMPTASIAAMFAIEFGNNEAEASAGVFITTLLSAVTIPLLVYFLLI